MIKVYSAMTGVPVHNLKNVMEAQGIACEVRGDHLRAAVGEVPPIEAWVELWVEEDRADEARKIIKDGIPDRGDDWVCAECNETVEANFGQCWNCGAYRPSETAPAPDSSSAG